MNLEASANINTLSCYALTLVNESNWFVSSRYKLHNLPETENIIDHCLSPRKAESTPFYYVQNTLSTVARLITTLAILF